MKPEVEVQHAELSANADRAWEALASVEYDTVPPIIVRGNELVFWAGHGYGLISHTITSLTDLLSRCTRFFKVDNKTGEPDPVDPPRAIADVLLERATAEYGGAAFVDSVIDVPVLGRSGSVVDRPGYHEKDRLLYVPNDVVGEIVTRPVETVDEVIMAREALMDDLFGDFGFADESSKANALALLLTPFVREYIGDHPTPLFLIVAPEVGTGKSLLAQAALMPSCGPVPLTAETKSEEEQRKRITATLVSGSRAIVLDNITGGIASNVLAGAITSGIWTDRLLGESKQLVIPVRNVWVATGNNLDLTDDNMRRAVPIILEPGDVRPSDRPKGKFRHSDLLGWARSKRRSLAEDALTLVRHWSEGEAVMTHGGERLAREEHRRERPERTLGSFERWGDVVGGILAAADVKGFLENRVLVGGFNNEREETADFFRAWRELDLDPLKVGELLGLCAYGGELREVLPESLQTDRQLGSRELGTWLRGKRGARFDGLRLERDKQRRTWRVI